MKLLCTFFVSSSFIFSTTALANSKAHGVKILDTLSVQTKAQSYKSSDIPQNFGGTAPKMAMDQSAQLSKRATEIASSDEAVFQEVVKSFFEPFESQILKRNVSDSLFEKNLKTGFSFGVHKNKETRQFEGIHQNNWKLVSSETDLNKMLSQMNAYLSEFKSIDYVDLSPYSIKTTLAQREPASFQPRVFTVDVRLDLRGLDKKNQKRQDRVEFTLMAEKKNESGWLARSLKLVSGESLVTSKSFFKESSSFADVKPANYLRREAIRRGGYALSTCDYNNDGLVDMLIGHMGAFEAFQGVGKGKFKKVSNSALGLENDTLVKSIVCNDYDNDGLKDLLVVRFAPSEEKGNDIILYHNQGEKFVKSTSIKNRQPAYYAMPSAVADYNNDGLLDFYIGFPGAKDFTVVNKSANGFADLKEAHPQGLFYNLGKFSFNEVTKEKIPYSRTRNAYTDGYPEAAVVFPHTSAGIDYNLDGTMDIVVIDDKANLSPLYKNLGNGHFAQVADKIGVTNYDFGMGFAAADLDNDGYLEFIYTNVNFLPTERLHNNLVNNFSEYSRIAGTYGVRIFKTKDGKNYSDITALSGISHPGYGVGGVEIIDYNNDGYADIYVPNGLWSGSKNSKYQDITSLFTRAYVKYDYDYEEIMGTPAGVEQANTSFMKVLTDFRGNIYNQKPNLEIHPSMTGFQRNRMYRNNGDGSFTEVGYMLGVDTMSDGYIATTADLNKDGKMDLLVRNVDPGSDKNMFPAVQVFMNESAASNKAVILSLEGTRTNRDAVGAIVEATIGKNKLVRHLVANNGSAQSENILHFGLNKNAKIDVLKIRWPSGTTDIHKNVPAGRHHYKESNIAISAR